MLDMPAGNAVQVVSSLTRRAGSSVPHQAASHRRAFTDGNLQQGRQTTHSDRGGGKSRSHPDAAAVLHLRGSARHRLALRMYAGCCAFCWWRLVAAPLQSALAFQQAHRLSRPGPFVCAESATCARSGRGGVARASRGRAVGSSGPHETDHSHCHCTRQRNS